MKKLLIKLLVIFLLILITCIGIWVSPGNYISDLAIIINKMDILRSKASPGMIFIGGSNLLSLNSPLIEKEFNYSVVNMGLFGVLNIKHVLNEIRPYLRPSDVIIIISEYGALLNNGKDNEVDEESKRYYLLASPGKNISRYMRNNEYFTLLREISELFSNKIKTYMRNIIDINFSNIFAKGRTNYQDYFNKYGDRKTPYSHMRPLYGSKEVFPVHTSQAFYMNRFSFLNDYNNFAISNNVKVFLFMAPFPLDEYKLNETQINLLYNGLKKNIKIPILNSPDDFTFPDEYFADCVYHLNSKGESHRTQKLINKLKKVL